MWVRAVAVAVVAVACGVATAQAQAAQYSEVWNPPEAAHPVKRAKGRTAVPVDARKGVTAGKGHKAVPLKKVASVHAAPGAKTHLARQATSPVRVAASAGASGRSAHAGTVRMAGARSASHKPVKTARSGGGHVQMAAVHPKAMPRKQQKVAAKPVSTQPASTMAGVAPRPAPAQPVATMADTAARPVAQSSNLPPILH
ncbi:hypothetical protein P3T17_001484 [Paraburkholderia sp. GAS82]